MEIRAEIAASLDVTGASAQICDYAWNAGAQISVCEPDFAIHYRSFPAHVGVAACLPEGRLQKFGQLMFFPPELEVKTEYAAKSEQARNVCCRFNREWLQRIWTSTRRWTASDLPRCLDMRNGSIEHALQCIGSELVDPSVSSTVLIESLANIVAIEIARHFGVESAQLRTRTRERMLSRADVNRIREYIESVEHRCPGMEEIAAICDVSAAHLRRSFKQTTGKRLYQFIDGLRFEKAQTLLAKTDLPIKEIAYRVGNRSAQTFATTFKRWAGETPSEYRRRHIGARDRRH